MAFRPLSSFIPTADELLSLDLPRLGRILLLHLKSYEGLNSVSQNGRLNRRYFVAMLEGRNVGLGALPQSQPEYGAKQSEVVSAMLEAWNHLERQGILIRDANQPDDWFVISRAGDDLLRRAGRFEVWEKTGVHRVKNDLMHTKGAIVVGGGLDVQDMAWEWVRMKEAQPKVATPPKLASDTGMDLISETRLSDLRALSSESFDFKKLVRLCEEINTSYSEKCYFATAMLIRAVLDHVPPIFGKNTFAEVANNYGGKSFKMTMQHLEQASRSVADGYLHQPIRRKESLPTAQQVNCGQQLDALLEEIVRMIE